MSPDLKSIVADAVRTGFLGKFRDSYNILVLAELLASADSAQYYLDHMSRCMVLADDSRLLEQAAQWRQLDGLVLEFGVARGRSINHLAELLPEKTIFGFDSFKGLPETWRTGFRQGTFATPVPEVQKNVSLVVGLFAHTLPQFVSSHAGVVELLHVDCDLYSSTCVIFEHLADRIVAGTIIVFDEYFNYPAWRLHEHKAFQEFIARSGKTYDYLGFVPHSHQVCVRMTG
jgi:predicted O-methyltransferase YrrM